MAKSDKPAKPEPIVIGKVGSLEVVKIDQDGAPLLRFSSKRLLGVAKIKDVLASADVCRQFIAQYDKPAEGQVLDLSKIKDAAQIKSLIEKLQALGAAPAAPAAGRVDPVASAAAGA